jgi:hypothetical protein
MKAKPAGGGKWKALVVLAVLVFLAVQTGWAGFGWAHLRAAVYPNDTALLGWVPGDAGGVVILDPHQLDLKALGGEGSTVRTALQRTRDDVKRAAGIDLVFDVDKLVFTPSLVVGRGRFDQKKLVEKLSAHHYSMAEHNGEVYLLRPGEDAIAVVGGSVLLYGDESGVKAAIDAHKEGTSLEKNDPVTARLSQAGWNHALLATVRITDDKPSLKAILTGATGPRAVTVGVSTPLGGLEVDAIVESASPSAAAELAKLLEEQRQHAQERAAAFGAEAAPTLADIAKKATIAADAQTSGVKAHVHVDPAELDKLVKNARSAVPVAEWYKTIRLFQLLAPGG